MLISALIALTLDASSPLLYLMCACTITACGYLGWWGGRKRAMKRAPSATPGLPVGTRVVVWVGLTMIFAIWFLAPGDSAQGRLFFLFVVLPIAALWILADVRQHQS